ncbi:MAG TPA: hypothetical protein VK956_09960, partial [Verrucomicrobium sp.]|nr:hypothetical protein [Verrucomicrobium sp.]
MTLPKLSFSLLLSLLAITPALLAESPKSTAAAPAPEILRYDWKDESRQRPVPVLIYLPAKAVAATPAPVIVFSHGLGGSRENYTYLGRYWAEAGYVSVHVQHKGSDDRIWRDAKPSDRMNAVRLAAMNPANALARPKDVSFVIDELTRLNAADSSPLRGRLDLNRIGVAGHSFGGFTAMAIAGQSFMAEEPRMIDPRVKAVIQMSAPVIGGQQLSESKFDAIRIPVFHMTGTKDDSPVGETMAADRRVPFDRMRHSDTCLVIFQDGDHMIFSGRMQPDASRLKQDEAFQKLICKGTTAFWDAQLRGKVDSKKWFYDGGFISLLGAAGTFEHKV